MYSTDQQAIPGKRSFHKQTPLHLFSCSQNSRMKGVSKALFIWTLLGLAVSGCTTNRFTNLTPSKLPRDISDSYLVEMAWESNNRTILEETIKAYAVVDEKFFPMNRTQVVKDRWEAMIPVSDSASYVNYYFKVDYQYKSIPFPKSDSDLSRPYSLLITEDFESLPVGEVFYPDQP